ncbi:MAG: hypothetical protein J6P05_04010 [Lachnospiraceae bacterium]|nr:hypothetical protein [Lachnospiraceae bacterium]
MINKLRRRFIFIAMGSLLMVLIAIFLLINWTTSVMATRTIMDRLRKIDEYASSLVEGVSPNGLNRHEMSQNRLARDGVPLRPIALQDFHYEARYFIVQIRTNGSKKYIDLSHITQVGPREAKQFTRIALRRRSNLGKIETANGTYLYLKQVEDGRVKHITFLDTTREREIIDTMLAMTILIGVFIYIAVFLLVTVLSKRAIYPSLRIMRSRNHLLRMPVMS